MKTFIKEEGLIRNVITEKMTHRTDEFKEGTPCSEK